MWLCSTAPMAKGRSFLRNVCIWLFQVCGKWLFAVVCIGQDTILRAFHFHIRGEGLDELFHELLCQIAWETPSLPKDFAHLNLIYQRKVWYFLGCHNLWKWMSLIKLMGSSCKWLEINIKWGQYTVMRLLACYWMFPSLWDGLEGKDFWEDWGRPWLKLYLETFLIA